MIAFKYIIFAILATILNLLTQYISLKIIDFLYLAIVLRTLSGLVCKYILDKKYIFYDISNTKKDNAKKFILYSFMGVVTTFVFWGFELGFNYVFDFEFAKYLGAIIGLAIGYITKYFLDKKYVFTNKGQK